MSSQRPIKMRELAGTMLGDRYQLEEFIDEGAFGSVFRASQMAYGLKLREVALKISKNPMTDDEAHRVFGDALIMTRLADDAPSAAIREHFVMVHDAGRCPDGTIAGYPYLAMELVKAGSLKRSLKTGPFPLTKTINYFEQMLKAVAFMHESNSTRRPIAHRDLKPGNILVVRRSQGDLIKVTDFGLAVEVDLLLGWVETGGDLSYLAPESFSHDISSPQSDVYMLGLIFYEMLSGRNPFAGVGTHLRGADDEKRRELRRIHLAARRMETFDELDHNVEIRRQRALAQVIRQALSSEMTTRSFRNAGELQDAWERAKKENTPKVIATPWDTVRRLTNEAEQCFAVNDHETGDSLLAEAMTINRDRIKVPNTLLVGRSYFLMVKRLLARGDIAEAEVLASEGYERRECRSTLMALSKYYEPRNLQLAEQFKAKAESCSDQE